MSSLQSLYRVHSPGQSFFSLCEQAPSLQQAPVHTPFGWHFPSFVHFAGAAQAVSSMPSLKVPSTGLQQAPRGMLSLFAQSAWPHFTPDDHAPAQSDSTPSEHCPSTQQAPEMRLAGFTAVGGRSVPECEATRKTPHCTRLSLQARPSLHVPEQCSFLMFSIHCSSRQQAPLPTLSRRAAAFAT